MEDNINPCKSMVMNAMEINQDYSSEYSPNISLNKESNVNPTRFFKLMKVFDEPL